MFEEYYAPLPNQKRYMERLGLSGPFKADKETLDRLIQAQQLSIPFENLDVYDAGREIRLDTKSLFDKLIVHRRGGYCFELNALFMALLRCVGFEGYPVAVRVIWGLDEYMPVAHRAGIIELDGKQYFCDVGFGGPQPRAALDLSDKGPQRTGHDTFIFSKASDGDTILSRLTTAGDEHLLKFSERPCQNVDFLAPNEYQSKNPNSGFKKQRMVNIATEDGSIAIDGQVLRIHDNTEVTEKMLETEEELKAALKEFFGIVVDFPLKI